MRKSSEKHPLITIAILSVMISGVLSASASPTITGISPSSAEPGVTIGITGTDFGSTANSISFNGLASVAWGADTYALDPNRQRVYTGEWVTLRPS